MLRFRRFLCSCFGYIAALYAFAAFWTVYGFVREMSRPHSLSPAAGHTVHVNPLIRFAFSFLANLIRALPLILAALYAPAWWTVKTGKTSGRRWAIAASIGMLTAALALLVGIFLILDYPRFVAMPVRVVPISIWLFPAFHGIVGITGLVAFLPRDSCSQKPLGAVKPPKVAGDGTGRITDVVSVVVVVAGLIGGLEWWGRWARAEHLPMYPYGFPLSVIILGLLISTVLHESGHALTGMALGMKVRAFLIGPFQWRIRDGKWKFRFALSKILSGDGATGMVPSDPNQASWKFVAMIAAGPVASLAMGLTATGFALTAKRHPWELYWGLFAVIAIFGAVDFIVNLLPINPAGLYSDGAKIYQLIKGGPWADVHRAMSLAGSSLVTPLQPRDYDIEAIQRAERTFTGGSQGMLLRLLATSYYLDRGLDDEARTALAEAESICEESLDVPVELCMAFVFHVALLRRDPVAAQRWWDRMEASKPTHFGIDYWLAKSALLLAKGRVEEASETWSKANEFAEQAPVTGDSNFDRLRSRMLRQAIDSTLALRS